MSDKRIQQIPLFLGESQSTLASVIQPLNIIEKRKPSDTLGVCVLGSGSGGNASVFRCGETSFLVDAGFGPRTMQKRLEQAGLALKDIDAIFVTHLDQDHFRKHWTASLLKFGIPVYLHSWHYPELMRMQGGAELRHAGLAIPFSSDPFEPVPGVAVSTVRLQHDKQGTIGFRFDCGGLSAGYATDLGHAPKALIEHLAGVDILCLECNYDEHMTTTSSRPSWVNRRNMSDSGHLSNEQSFEAVRAIADASPHGNPRHVVLLHRSSQCNHPMKVRRVFERDESLSPRITLTEQRRRTRWLNVKPLPAGARSQMRLAR